MEQAIRLHGAVLNVSVDGFKKALSNPSRLKRKNVFFLQAEVFFLLTRPLIGDPLVFYHIEKKILIQ
ncbi:MAG: hypothetical protein SRB2_02896 [Desulfobacteraceae bacterium Eth-SRB2]|nr:MAG: hypothetical protein SRB2_02896 [Desulfobacteraceae bacterium Eth-SRB2]